MITQDTMKLLLSVYATLVSVHALLPNDFVPFHYNLHFVFDVDPANNFSFFAVAEIQITVLNPVAKIQLHGEDLDIISHDVGLHAEMETRQVLGVQSENGTLIFHIDASLSWLENYTLVVPYRGKLNSVPEGIFADSYENIIMHRVEYLIGTNFEPVHARKAFPCFDEPSLKATFRVVIGHHRNYLVLTNMPFYQSSKDSPLEEHMEWDTVIRPVFNKSKDEFRFDHFLIFPRMSTYMVGFLICQLTSQNATGVGKTRISIWTRQNAVGQAQYAAEITPKLMDFYQSYFNMSFPLPKLDIVAIPNQSTRSAENWGLLTFPEANLLFKDSSPIVNRKQVAMSLAYALAHQWFGNLVAIRLWTNVWLREGVASYIATHAVTHIEPTWAMEDMQAVHNMMTVLDRTSSSQSVFYPEILSDDPSAQVSETISHDKAYVLIRMISGIMGKNNLRLGIIKFLNKYQERNDDNDEMFEVFALLSANVTVKEVMDPWIQQPGYPVLTVIRDYSNSTAAVSQAFCGPVRALVENHPAWWVPLRVRCQEDPSKSPNLPAAPELQWLSPSEGTSTPHHFQHGSSSQEWLLFNYDMLAPIRVNYDLRNWKLLSLSLREHADTAKEVPLLGRVQLVTDAFSLAWHGLLEYSVPFRLVSFIKQETQYLPISTALLELSRLDNVLSASRNYGVLLSYVRKLIKDNYMRSGGLYKKKITHANDLPQVSLQTLLSQWACRVEIPNAEQTATEYFLNWMQSQYPDEIIRIPPDLRMVVYCVAIKNGNSTLWNFLYARMKNAQASATRREMLAALGCSLEPSILEQLIEWAVMEPSQIQRQDASWLLSSVIRNSHIGYYLTRDFIYSNTERFVASLSTIDAAETIKLIACRMTQQREVDEFLMWQRQHRTLLAHMEFGISKGLNVAKSNILWLDTRRIEAVSEMRKLLGMPLTPASPVLRTVLSRGQRSLSNQYVCLYLLMTILFN